MVAVTFEHFLANFAGTDDRLLKRPDETAEAAPAARAPVSSDKLLVRQVQAGDRRAFDLLVLKYQHKVLALASRYAREPQDAADIAQESFIRAYRALPNFRGDSQFYTWLYRITVNTAKNQLATAGRQPRMNSYEDLADVQPERLGEAAGPGQEHDSSALAAVVQEAFHALPADLHQALAMREFDGCSYEDIAQAMQTPIGTVRSRISRGRAAIDRKVQAWQAGEEN